MDAEVYIGAAVTSFLVKLAVVVVLGHIALALFVPAWYGSLTHGEYMVCQDFINGIANLWHQLLGQLFGV
jgi:hypothetical protein